MIENIYKFYSSRYFFVLEEYFPYVKLLKQESNYHFQFLVIKKDYAYEKKLINLIIKKYSDLKNLKGTIYINNYFGHNTIVASIKIKGYKISHVRLARKI